MRIIRNIRGFKAPRKTVITLGNFDGVHLGHQAVIRRVVDRAKKTGALSAVITFSPHTQSYLSVDRSCHVLSLPGEKARLIAQLGVDLLVILKFDGRLRAMDGTSFLKKVVFRHLKPAEIFFGRDHRFGMGRGGNEKMLKRICRENKVRARRMPDFSADEQVISSTLIRELLSMGKVEAAVGLLGHPYLVCGRVEKGFGRGRTLGFPTANLMVEKEKLLMPNGVYLGSAETGGREYPALISLGTRPTFGKSERALEAFLKGFSGDLYGKNVCLNVKGFLRPQKRMKNIEQLKRRIRKDLEYLD